MDEIVIMVMSGPRDGDVLTFETLLDSGEPIELIIGRREGCDICLNYDSQVSREHARLIGDGDTCWLEDNASTNGTYIEDEKIEERTMLGPGRLFRIGRTWLRIEPDVPTIILDDDMLYSDDLPF